MEKTFCPAVARVVSPSHRSRLPCSLQQVDLACLFRTAAMAEGFASPLWAYDGLNPEVVEPEVWKQPPEANAYLLAHGFTPAPPQS